MNKWEKRAKPFRGISAKRNQSRFLCFNRIQLVQIMYSNLIRVLLWKAPSLFVSLSPSCSAQRSDWSTYVRCLLRSGFPSNYLTTKNIAGFRPSADENEGEREQLNGTAQHQSLLENKRQSAGSIMSNNHRLDNNAIVQEQLWHIQHLTLFVAF